MASKRTRSATQRLADGDSSNVTDYLGPSKRQKRANAKNSRANSEQEFSVRLTRSEAVRKIPPEQMPAAAHSGARPSLVLEEDDEHDDEEVVNVNFNTVVCATNDARRGRPRTVNGVQVTGIQASLDPTASDGEGDDEAHNEEEDNSILPRSAVHRLRRQIGKPLDSTPVRELSQHTGQLQGNSNGGTVRRDLYEFVASSPESPAHMAPQKPSFKSRIKASVRSRPRQEHESSMRSLTVPRIAHNDASSDSNEDSVEEILVEVGEDSAFIEAPRPDENLATVEAVINSIGGMIATLGRSAWTGTSKWDASFDTARGGIQDDGSKCRTVLGRKFMELAKALRDIFESAAAAKTSDEDEDHSVIDYLRNHSGQVVTYVRGIDILIGKICTEELANTGEVNLAGRAIKKRRALLKDVAKRLIPMIVLVIQETCNLGPAEPHGGKLHLQLSSYTLQFFLRSVGWARRLERALTRGLEQWPIDPEFRRNEEELDQDEFKSKQTKKKSRSVFEKQISALHDKAREAERTMQKDVREGAREKLRERRRQRHFVQDKALHAAQQNIQAEESRRAAEGWQAFCRSIQALEHARDPMKEKWDAAEKACSQQQASTRSHFYHFTQYAQPSSQAPIPRGSQGDANRIENGLSKTKATQPHAAMHAFRTDARSSGVGREHGTDQELPAPNEPWGLDWTPREEKILLTAIRYDRNYLSDGIALELRRDEFDVARKAAAVKKAYRSIYRERGRPIPEWAL